MKSVTIKELLEAKLISPEDTACSSMHMNRGDLESLSHDQKRRLVRWMARIMEKAYRRGVQQTLHLLENEKIDEWILENPHSYRYEKCLDISIGLDGFTTSSVERLEAEEDLIHQGLFLEANEVYNEAR